jgi:hypothetical protein
MSTRPWGVLDKAKKSFNLDMTAVCDIDETSFNLATSSGVGFPHLACWGDITTKNFLRKGHPRVRRVKVDQPVFDSKWP